MSLSDETIYTKHKDDLIRYATALVGAADAEDVLSTVVLRVLERRSLSDLVDARAYLFRAVLNEARGRLRRGKPALPRDEASWIPEGDFEVVTSLRRLPPVNALRCIWCIGKTCRSMRRPGPWGRAREPSNAICILPGED